MMRRITVWTAACLIATAGHGAFLAWLLTTPAVLPPPVDLPPLLLDLPPAPEPVAAPPPPTTTPPPPMPKPRPARPIASVRAEPPRPAPTRLKPSEAPPLSIPGPIAAVPEALPPETSDAAPAAAPDAPAPTPAPRHEAPPNWISKVLGRLERFKRYPATARADRLEGVPLARITIDRSGHVLSVTLARSSGIPALDEEAIRLPGRADPLPPPPEELSGNPIELLLPVRFSVR